MGSDRALKRLPIFTAAQHGQLQAVKLLLDHVDPTPAVLGAVTGEHDDVLQLVLAAPGVDVNARLGEFTPIEAAVRRGNVAITSRLLAAKASASVDALLCSAGSPRVVELVTFRRWRRCELQARLRLDSADELDGVRYFP